MLRQVAKLAVAVTVAAPGFSQAVTTDQIRRWQRSSGLTYLIRAAWTEGEAAERGIGVTDARAREAADAKPHDGLTTTDLVYEARIELLNAEIRGQIGQPAALSVTPEQIDAYVKTHARTSPGQRTVRIIAARNRAHAKAARKSIAHGLTWASAGRRYASGRRPRRITYEAAPSNRLQRAIFRAREGGPTRYGRYVFTVTRITPPGPLPVEQQRASAWEVLASEAQRQAIAAYEAHLPGKWRPRTLCAAAFATHPDCRASPVVE